MKRKKIEKTLKSIIKNKEKETGYYLQNKKIKPVEDKEQVLIDYIKKFKEECGNITGYYMVLENKDDLNMHYFHKTIEDRIALGTRISYMALKDYYTEE